MMNLFQVQDRLKDFSEQQLQRAMKAPTPDIPQYLVLGEMQRRKRMQADFQAQQSSDTTVAEDAMAAAGLPGMQATEMSRALAPKTDMGQNTAVTPSVRMAEGGRVGQGGLDQSRLYSDPAVLHMAAMQGMSVEEFVSAMDPIARAQHLTRIAGAGTAFDPAADASAFGDFQTQYPPDPTQSDLDLGYMADTRDERFGIGTVPGMMEPPSYFDVDETLPSPGMSDARSFDPLRPSLAPDPLKPDMPNVRAPSPHARHSGPKPPPPEIPDIMGDVIAMDPAQSTSEWPDFLGPGMTKGVPVSITPESTIGYDPDKPFMDMMGPFGLPPGPADPPALEMSDIPITAYGPASGNGLFGVRRGVGILPENMFGYDPDTPFTDQMGPFGLPPDSAEPENVTKENENKDVPDALEDDLRKANPTSSSSSSSSSFSSSKSDDIYEMDKRLALAKFGFALAASDAPTFGRAFGQAGIVGLDALSAASKDRQARELLARKAAARGASKSGLTLKQTLDYLMEERKLLGDERIALANSSGYMTEAQRIAAERSLAAKEEELQRAVHSLTGIRVMASEYAPPRYDTRDSANKQG